MMYTVVLYKKKKICISNKRANYLLHAILEIW